MALTTKQERFCIEVVKQPTLSAAYRIAYNVENTTDKSVNELASTLMKDIKIISRVSELKNKVESKELYTLEESIKKDLKLIKRYEDALSILENKDAQVDDLTAAERTIKFITSSGYSSAQDRLAKKQGWFEKDNSQRKAEFILPSKKEVKKISDDLENDY